MARVTVEDCILKIPNRFELVMLAAQRARHVSAGAGLTVDRDNDKNPVVALREIADETVDLKGLENALVQGLQKFVESDEPDEGEMDMLALNRDAVADAQEIKEDLSATADEEILEDVLSVHEMGGGDEAGDDDGAEEGI